MNYTEFIDNAKAAFGENLGGRIPLRRSNGNGGYDYQLEYKPGADNAKMHGWEDCPEVPPEAIRPVAQIGQDEPRKPGRPATK